MGNLTDGNRPVGKMILEFSKSKKTPFAFAANAQVGGTSEVVNSLQFCMQLYEKKLFTAEDVKEYFDPVLADGATRLLDGQNYLQFVFQLNEKGLVSKESVRNALFGQIQGGNLKDQQAINQFLLQAFEKNLITQQELAEWFRLYDYTAESR